MDSLANLQAQIQQIQQLMQQPRPSQPAAPQKSTTTIPFVDGLEGARTFLKSMGPNSSAAVFDKEEAVFYTLINRIGNDRLDSLSTADFLVINALYHEQPLDENLHHRLKPLVDMGIVEHIGRSKYVLARSLYSAAGKSGVHTRIVGLDRDTNKELLMKHIRENRTAGTPLRELQQVLPSQSRRQIQMLLNELRYENRIHKIGNTSAARWFDGPAPFEEV